MKHNATQRLYEYWDSIRGPRPAPDRSEIDPAHLRSVLGDTFILEGVDETTFRYRLAGTRLCALHCRELKGKNILRGWSQSDHNSLSSILAAVRHDAAVAVLEVQGLTEHGQSVDLEMLLLPLHMPGEGCSRILGICAPMQTPYWMGMHPILEQSIGGLRLIWPNKEPRLASSPSPTALSTVPQSTPPNFPAHLAQPRRRVQHLTVIQGGKH